MSLYDIFGEDPVHEKGDDDRSSKKLEMTNVAFFSSEVWLHLLSIYQQKPHFKGHFLRPHKAMPLGDGPPLSFIPKALKEDKVCIPFGEILVEDEYNPTAPTDYAKHKQKMDERKAKEKIAKEIAERLNREHQEEIAKRTSGAAIAPPKTLMEEDSKVEPPASPDIGNTASEMPPPSFIPSFGAGKGLGVAANIMSKFGYKEGTGLGRSGQGMSTALKVERLGKNSGVIVNEHEFSTRAEASISPPVGLPTISATPAVNMTEALKQSSRILLLRNMVGPDEIDDQLEPEVKDEMKKYGQLSSLMHSSLKIDGDDLLQANDDEAVRIFVEFTNVGQAIKAFVDLNGRFFGGRSIKASFYDLEAYNANQFDR
ncbi:SPF45 [Dirofilaria immitis]|nr:SPF45 [Dirofilaria immitis]